MPPPSADAAEGAGANGGGDDDELPLRSPSGTIEDTSSEHERLDAARMCVDLSFAGFGLTLISDKPRPADADDSAELEREELLHVACDKVSIEIQGHS